MSPLKVMIGLFVLFGLVRPGDTPAGQLVCFWTDDPGGSGSQDAPLPGCARVSRPRLDTCKVCEAEEQQVILVCNLSNPRAEVIREADRGEVHENQRGEVIREADRGEVHENPPAEVIREADRGEVHENQRGEVIWEADRGGVHKNQCACPALAEEAVTDE